MTGAPPGFECPPDKYKCDGVHQCVDFTKLCNGFGDCPEAEDEGIQCSKCAYTLHFVCLPLYVRLKVFDSMLVALCVNTFILFKLNY